MPGAVLTPDFPVAADTAVTLGEAKNNAATALTVDAASGDATLTVASTTAFPSTGAISLENEIIYYTGKTATTFTGCSRGQDNTTAAAHVSTTPVEGRIIAQHHGALSLAIRELEGKVGIGADTPAAAQFFKGTGAGTSEWSALTNAELVTGLGYTPVNLAGDTMTGALVVTLGNVTVKRDAASSILIAETYGAANLSTFLTRKGRGTIAAPLRVKTGDPLLRLAGVGAYAADDVSAATLQTTGSPGAAIDFLATQDFTATAQGSSISFKIVPLNGTGFTEKLLLNGTQLLPYVSIVPKSNVVSSMMSWDDEIGTSLSHATNRAPLRMGLALGTGGLPVTTAGAVFKISKTENIATGVLSTDQANDESAAISVFAANLATSQVQVVAGHFVATSISTESGFNDDACATIGIGRIMGTGSTGYGIGGYFEGRADSATHANAGLNGIEARSNNQKGVDHSYVSTGPSLSMGLWVTNWGDTTTRRSAVGIAVGRLQSNQWDVGLGFAGDSVLTTTMRDDTNAATSLFINGTHATAGIAVATAAAGPLLLGGTARLLAGTYQEIQVAATADPAFMMHGVTSSVSASMRVSNGAGTSLWFVAGSAGSFLASTAQGDTGIRVFTAGKSFHIGSTTKVLTITGGNLLGFFAATPVAQAGSTADLRQALIDYGLVATGGASPLNLNGGALANGTQTFTDATNIVVGSTTGTKIGTAITQKLGFWDKTPVVQPAAYTPTNVGADRAYNANATTIDELADVLGTLVADLQSVGLIG